ncbi:uncharacterized protein LOC110999635 [Pieris rapae]|uniref:uncharacterized protein LOC110999635 n=1 Tax=Pieris rapae TaxID=64459 RepID=UPI000B927136|nr:uncharacterized protein LOC110999635 [Pieris rapae]
MVDKDILSKVADIPLQRPGFDALEVSAPILVQMNPNGKWENTKPGNLDEERLKAIVQHLVKSKALSAAQSYCCQCASEGVKGNENSNYIPVIMMPIYSADDCPFDLDCEAKKIKEAETKPTKKEKVQSLEKDSDKDKDKKKSKKRGFVLQRLTDFDLLSQW